VDLHVEPGRVSPVRSGVEGIDGVEHVFVTADGHVVFHARLQDGAVEPLLDEVLDTDDIREYDVRLLADSTWHPDPRGVEFALECDECGNSVTSEGESSRIDGDLYQFCCSSCEAQFESRYERLDAAAKEHDCAE